MPVEVITANEHDEHNEQAVKPAWPTADMAEAAADRRHAVADPEWDALA